MILKQKQGLSKREFELLDEVLKVKTKDSGESREWTIKIEHLGDEKYYEYKSNVGAKIVAGFFIAFPILATISLVLERNKSLNIWTLLAIYALFGGLALLMILNPQKRELHLIGGSLQASFFLDSPSKEKVDEFVDEIINRSKKILIEKYGKVDPDLPEDTQMNQLNWLKNRNLISDKEYQLLKQEYKTKRLINGL